MRPLWGLFLKKKIWFGFWHRISNVLLQDNHELETPPPPPPRAEVLRLQVHHGTDSYAMLGLKPRACSCQVRVLPTELQLQPCSKDERVSKRLALRIMKHSKTKEMQPLPSLLPVWVVFWSPSTSQLFGLWCLPPEPSPFSSFLWQTFPIHPGPPSEALPCLLALCSEWQALWATQQHENSAFWLLEGSSQ